MEKVETKAQNTPREVVIQDLRIKLGEFRKMGYTSDPQFYIVQRALTLENKVHKGEEEGFFSTGFAGRKGVDWKFKGGKWSGELLNRQSGIAKNRASGKSAEEMLTSLLRK